MGITRHIPNTITSMNLLSGAMGVIFTFQGELALAFVLMLAAAVFDFCDGLAARSRPTPPSARNWTRSPTW